MTRNLITLSVMALVFAACPKPKPPQPPQNPCQLVECPENFVCTVVEGTAKCLKVETPEPPTPPKPPVEPFCTQGRLMGNFHPYLQGLDATWICVGDHDFCVTVGLGFWEDGSPRYDCALGGDGTALRFSREETLGCPAYFWRKDGSDTWQRCLPTPIDGGVSCTHFDLHNVPPFQCAPSTGFFTIPHGGKGEDGVKKFMKICSLVKPEVCSKEQEVNGQ